jgi:hypothetical protein
MVHIRPQYTIYYLLSLFSKLTVSNFFKNLKNKHLYLKRPSRLAWLRLPLQYRPAFALGAAHGGRAWRK